MDTEAFLADLTIYGATGNTTTTGGGPYLFRVVTQRYGKGIVQYGNNNQTAVFPNSLTDGGQYDDICDAQGFIYLEIDAQVPPTVHRCGLRCRGQRQGERTECGRVFVGFGLEGDVELQEVHIHTTI
jgi:hypothetical protein